MQIRLLVYHPFRGRGIWQGSEQIPAGLTAGALLSRLGLEDQPGLTVLVNGRIASPSLVLQENDEVAILHQSEGG